MKNILIIDDSVFDRLIASEVIKSSLFNPNVVALESAEEGLAYISERIDVPSELPDIILLDIIMPKVDGFEFLNRYEKLIDSVAVPTKIHILSSTVDPNDFSKALKSKHVQDCIEKPLTRESVEALLLTSDN
ncbi:response regulator [Flavobacterium suncheonense]|uniref:Response regulatory domain-containing protein n=1 Tax=Flavobacterium suncheonense GH29-5 = DSM 17707 TaxID=1121899 RepID=A0A0A2MCN2_9FLAO|nr:response regulator [Flavobacterium suncheonense]KGO89396.1 hypothetical protein Q764_08430 [Flavobacterium suncheonense GH29-5 = DSM 17707]